MPGELTDDALENKLFSRNGVKQQGTRRRTEPNWADLAVELKKPGVTLLILGGATRLEVAMTLRRSL
ncbi:hypothetical protein NKH19_32340 [Mesorhizobium sp. M1338]|uniref:hypothetical protein n=1 Tax=Mesorhizobium sp. M1338 TaxID=2957085 RepID=UPI00333519F4